MNEPDDAGVYRISDDSAIILTLDFFTPIVDDPYLFGQIAAANSLSDVYAMGGKPVTAMNILCFPVKTMDMGVAREIITGGLDKLNEDGVLLVGGHSVVDEELKYGLSVTGIVKLEKIIRKGGAKPGDKIILTKPIGTGAVSTAIKGNMAEKKHIEYMIDCMKTLNNKASIVMQNNNATAGTDITGFGLIGHLYEILKSSSVSAKINLQSMPFIEGAASYVSIGLMPEGLYRNKNFYMDYVVVGENINKDRFDLLFDPQTSGGLLFCTDHHSALNAIEELKNSGIESAAIIGEIENASRGVEIFVS